MANVGDHLGEHLAMKRGKRSAWPHVIIGAVIMGFVSAFVLSGICELIVSGLFSAHDFGVCSSAMSLLLTSVFIFWVYLDRWRVNEAYTSRYVTGPVTLIYLPMVSIGYALSRAVERTQTKFGS
jgi:hypothetical protein